jgi:hypothetical protein
MLMRLLQVAWLPVECLQHQRRLQKHGAQQQRRRQSSAGIIQEVVTAT